MARKIVVVGAKTGLHARPASVIADAAGEYDEEILLTIEGSEKDGIDAASSMLIMTLGAKHGDKIIVESDDEDAVAEIAALIEKDLDSE
ncbi:MAG: HPr family phosphocarrier protein [Propionibacteriaceae bacterium]